MRVFFAIDLEPSVRDAIAAWRARTMLPAGRATPAANLHITLHFVGEVSQRRLEKLLVEAEQVNAPAFQLHLDRAGYFPSPGIFWLAPSVVPAELTELARGLRRATKRAGVAIPAQKKFIPHLTLFRGCRARPPLPTTAADFALTADAFALFQSVTAADGARYRLLRRWSLG